MSDYPIKLGKTMSETMSPMKMDPDEEHYPSLYLEWDGQYDLPDSGTMTVKFNKCCQTDREDKDGKSQSVTLDITEIVDVEPEKESKSEDAGETLDKYRNEVEGD